MNVLLSGFPEEIMQGLLPRMEVPGRTDATICIQPDKIALIELKEINGVPSLVIPVNGELKINGIEVELR